MKKLSIGLLLGAVIFLNLAFSACTPEEDSGAEVRHCKVTLSSYPQIVHFYFPSNSNGNFAVHFHGHNLQGYSHFDKRWGDYGQYLANSKANFVLIVPQSLGNCTTYDQFFVDKTKTEAFFAEVKEVIKEETGEGGELLSLSGHSGAYRVLNRLAGHANQNLSSLKNLRAIGMFDATYGSTLEITKFVKANNALFYDAFVTGPKATTEDMSRTLMKDLKGDNVFFVPVKGEAGESLLDQHFMVLKRGSLETFFAKASTL